MLHREPVRRAGTLMTGTGTGTGIGTEIGTGMGFTSIGYENGEGAGAGMVWRGTGGRVGARLNRELCTCLLHRGRDSRYDRDRDRDHGRGSMSRDRERSPIRDQGRNFHRTPGHGRPPPQEPIRGIGCAVLTVFSCFWLVDNNVFSATHCVMLNHSARVLAMGN